MDNLKTIFEKMWKQRFWVISGTISLLGIIFLFIVTGGLRGDAEKRNQDIANATSGISRLRGIPNHPNPDFHEEQRKLNESLTTAVEYAWDLKWKDQTEILTWPSELGVEFIQDVEMLRPIEKKLPLQASPGLAEPLGPSFRGVYSRYISRELPGLAESVKAVWVAAEDRSTASTDVVSSMVHWNPENQQEIQDEYFRWPERKNAIPTTLDVLYAQEDLWVLQALTKIIAETNDGCDARHNLIIKDINFIKIGPLAGVPSGDIQFLAAASDEEGNFEGSEEEASFGYTPEFEEEGGFYDEEYSTNTGEEEIKDGYGQPHPANGRYVDKNYLPLPADQLWSAGDSEDPELAYLAVAKRMPIRVGVTMDQREINRLLVQCGNSPLTVEVRQVRINPSASSKSIESGYASGGFGEEDEEYEERGDTDNGNIGLYDVPVEIYGIIYIFNPVDGDKLRPSESELDPNLSASTTQPPENS